MFARLGDDDDLNSESAKKKAISVLCKVGANAVPGSVIHSFEEILKALDFVLHEDSLLLGSYRVRRFTGYTIGGFLPVTRQPL